VFAAITGLLQPLGDQGVIIDGKRVEGERTWWELPSQRTPPSDKKYS
jgi:hypothetical protein